MSSTKPAIPALPTGKVGQSLAGYVREHLAELEALLETGVKYETLLKAVEQAGLGKQTYGALDNALYRARKKVREGLTRRPAKPAVAGVSPPAALPPAPSAQLPPGPAKPGVRLTPTADLKPDDLI